MKSKNSVIFFGMEKIFYLFRNKVLSVTNIEQELNSGTI